MQLQLQLASFLYDKKLLEVFPLHDEALLVKVQDMSVPATALSYDDLRQDKDHQHLYDDGHVDVHEVDENDADGADQELPVLQLTLQHTPSVLQHDHVY